MGGGPGVVVPVRPGMIVSVRISVVVDILAGMAVRFLGGMVVNFLAGMAVSRVFSRLPGSAIVRMFIAGLAMLMCMLTA